MIGIRSMLKGLAAAVLVPALAAPAAARWVDTVDGWEVDMAPKICTMTTTFSDNTSIALVWSPSTSELGFMAGVPRTPDIVARKTAPLELSFDGEGPYNQWEDQVARVVPGEDSVGVVGNWGAEHAGELAKAVASASHVGVRVAGRDVGRYELSGGGDAYQALMKCGRLLAAN
jgi:hypothetical protein